MIHVVIHLPLVHEQVDVDKTSKIQKVQRVKPSDQRSVIQDSEPLSVPTPALEKIIGCELVNIVDASEVEGGRASFLEIHSLVVDPVIAVGKFDIFGFVGIEDFGFASGAEELESGLRFFGL